MSGFIALLWNKTGAFKKDTEKMLKEKTNLLVHRGPDEEGYYFDDDVSLGVRNHYLQLESACQPYHDKEKQVIVAFNGAIYNMEELRQELIERGYLCVTSEPSVVAALFSEYRERAFEKIRGMFSILIWDKDNNTLYAARDYFGIKPLFYTEHEEGMFFSSEKKALLTSTEASVDLTALQHYMSFQYVPEPQTLTKGIKKLEPGHYIVKKIEKPLEIHRYWKASFAPVIRAKDEWIKQIRNVLYDSVSRHIQSDASVGSLLSGGIDSTLLVSIAKETHPYIKTFSVGFECEGFSEIDVAKETALKLGVENISYEIKPEEYVAELPKIIWHTDDPLADPACVPLYFAAREAKKHVDIALSGEGADELFGGYNIYREPNALKIFNYIPSLGKKMLKILAQALPDGVRGKSFLERGTTPLHERYIGNAKIFEESEKRKLLKSYNPKATYQHVTSHLFQQVKDDSLVHQMQFIDIHTWLRGDILLKADRMSTAHSLEIRAPFLDKEVFDLAGKIPVQLTIAEGTTKHILREAARGIVPEHVLNRKKLGFPVPIRHWLRDELYDWVTDLIRESETDYLIDKKVVEKLYDEHCQGKMDNSRKIWTVLIFMLWHQIFIEEKYDINQFYSTDKESILS